MIESNFHKVVSGILESDIYENHSNWEARGLNPSEDSIIKILRSCTNDFLQQLLEVFESSKSMEEKLVTISNLADALPWFDLDTEEKEFLADVLAPAIKSAGVNPWSIF